jgi:hypothetical protein
MEKTKAEKRLKSWFCKSAALIISPFNETMVVDLDVIFFKKPDLLFESSAYRRTHSLFFRDRIAFQAKRARKDEVIYQDIIKNYILSKSNISNINSSIAKEYSNMNGYSFFWKNIANENEDALLDFQDSSIILLDSRWHQKTLEVLEELLPEFSIGWGDKGKIIVIIIVMIIIIIIIIIILIIIIIIIIINIIIIIIINIIIIIIVIIIIIIINIIIIIIIS